MSMIRNWLRRAEVDKAVIYALLLRISQLVTGPVTLILIAQFFSPQVQGYYYTFMSLLALQSFVNLGLYIVIINVASHEWAHLSLDDQGRIVGQPASLSRLTSLARFILKWYSVASFIFIGGVGLAGYLFLAQNDQADIAWRVPWSVLVFITGLQLVTVPFTHLLEGCNQVATVNRYRTYQSVCGSIGLWFAIWLGGGLWAIVVLKCVNLSTDLYLQLIRYRRFFGSFLLSPAGPIILWKREIWPMQWRLGLSGISNYFASALFVPVMFHYYGAVVAGQMGMTRQIIAALQGLALAWVSTKVPRYGIFIAQNDYGGLDRFWRRCSLMSLLVIGVGSVALWLLFYVMDTMQIAFAQRLLSPLPAAIFLFALIPSQIVQCLAAYLRAHKREPIVVASVTGCLLTGLLVWLLGSRFGALGAAFGHAVAMLMTASWISYIWWICRRIWHTPYIKHSEVTM